MHSYQHPKYSLHLLQDGTIQLNVLDGPQVMHGKMAKSEVILYAGKDGHEQLFTIRPRQGLNAKERAYDVFDAQGTTKVGGFEKQPETIGESWTVLDGDDLVVARISANKPLLRKIIKFFIRVIPDTYDVTLSGGVVVKFSVVPMVKVWWLDFTADTTRQLDRRVGIGAGICMALGPWR